MDRRDALKIGAAAVLGAKGLGELILDEQFHRVLVISNCEPNPVTECLEFTLTRITFDDRGLMVSSDSETIELTRKEVIEGNWKKLGQRLRELRGLPNV